MQKKELLKQLLKQQNKILSKMILNPYGKI